jgi:hypothetical protein
VSRVWIEISNWTCRGGGIWSKNQCVQNRGQSIGVNI